MTKELDSRYDRGKFGRELKIEAVRLVLDLGVAQAVRDLNVAESVSHRRIPELTFALAVALPGNGQMRTDLVEIAAVKKAAAFFA